MNARAIILALVMMSGVADDVVGQVPSWSVWFAGGVVRGQVFEKEIAGDLVFRLVPDEYGWKIWVGKKDNPDQDFSSVVTPPFRGMNHRYIKGWHFRNADNSGPNEPGAKNVNAPQKVREFAFVLNEGDHRVTSETLSQLLWPTNDWEREEARRTFEAVEMRTARGQLTIVDLALGNLIMGNRAWIDDMRFEVKLFQP